MEQPITITLSEYHALKTAADSNAELKATMNLTFLSKVKGGYFLSVITNDGQTAKDVHVVRIPSLQYLQMKKQGIIEINKDAFSETPGLL